jgi:hypothetical protein
VRNTEWRIQLAGRLWYFRARLPAAVRRTAVRAPSATCVMCIDSEWADARQPCARTRSPAERRVDSGETRGLGRRSAAVAGRARLRPLVFAQFSCLRGLEEVRQRHRAREGSSAPTFINRSSLSLNYIHHTLTQTID